ncbi:hypothetical protein P9112_010488 [Eukaryota sp. TZLM1-RC]
MNSSTSRLKVNTDTWQTFKEYIKGPAAFNQDPSSRKLEKLLNEQFPVQEGLYNSIRSKLPVLRSAISGTLISQLDDESLIALYAYTLDSEDIGGREPIYKLLNESLRLHRYACWNPLLSCLSKAMSKRLSYKERPTLFAGLNTSVSDSLKPNECIYLRDFRSCSEQRSTAEHFGSLLLRFTKVHALPLSRISRYSNEKEWLIPPSSISGCKFRITRVDTERNEVHLEQEPESC